MFYLRQAHDGLTRVGEVLGAFCICAIAAVVFSGTLSRYLFEAPLIWGPDTASYLLCAGVFLLAPVITRDRGHILIDVLPNQLTGRWKRLLQSLIAVISALTMIVLAYYTSQTLLSAIKSGAGTAAAFPIPRWVLLSFLAYGFGSTALYFARHAIGEAPKPEQE